MYSYNSNQLLENLDKKTVWRFRLDLFWLTKVKNALMWATPCQKKNLTAGLLLGIWHGICVSTLDLDNQDISDCLLLYLFHTVICRSQFSSLSWQSLCKRKKKKKDLHWVHWWLTQSKFHWLNKGLKLVKRKNKTCFNYWLKKKNPLHGLDKNNKAWLYCLKCEIESSRDCVHRIPGSDYHCKWSNPMTQFG